jgi:hypothetical protein
MNTTTTTTRSSPPPSNLVPQAPFDCPALAKLSLQALLPLLDKMPINNFTYLDYQWSTVATLVREKYDRVKAACEKNRRIPSPPSLSPTTLAAVENMFPNFKTVSGVDETLWRIMVEHYYPSRSEAMQLPFNMLKQKVIELCEFVKDPTKKVAVPSVDPTTLSRSNSVYNLTDRLVSLSKIPVSARLLEETACGKTLARFVRHSSDNATRAPYVTDHHIAIAKSTVEAWKKAVANTLDESATSRGMRPELSHLDDATLVCEASTWRELYDVLLSQRSAIAVHTEKMRALRDERNYARPSVKTASSRLMQKVVRNDKILVGAAARDFEARRASKAEAATPAGIRMSKLKAEAGRMMARQGRPLVANHKAEQSRATKTGFHIVAKKTQSSVKQGQSRMKMPKVNTAWLKGRNAKPL